jgi:LAO/AO transport system kinase
VINKSDGDAIKDTQVAKNEFARALHLYPMKENGWLPKVTTCSALYNKGIDEVYSIIETFIKHTKANSHFNKKRNQQNKNWFTETINNELKNQFYKNPNVQKELNKYFKKIENLEINPFKAALEILKNRH